MRKPIDFTKYLPKELVIEIERVCAMKPTFDVEECGSERPGLVGRQLTKEDIKEAYRLATIGV